MGATEVIALGALLVAVASAIFTYIEQYGRQARLSVLISDRAGLGYTPDYSPDLLLAIVFVNDGARYAPVMSLRASLSGPALTPPLELEWRSFWDVEDIGKPGESFTTHFAFKGWAYAVVVPGRQAVDKNVGFSGARRAGLAPGDYGVTVTAVVGAKRKSFQSRAARFALNAEQLNFLKDNCVADPKTHLRKRTLRIQLRQA